MNKLSTRLSLSFVIVAWLVIIVVAVLVQQTVGNNFRRYVHQRSVEGLGTSLIDGLETLYAENRNWDAAAALIATGRGGEQGQGRGQQGQVVLLVDPSGRVVATTDSSRVDTQIDKAILERAVPLRFDTQTVGWLLIEAPGLQALGDTETRFLADMTSALLVTAVGAGAVAVLVGALFGWRLGLPIRQLTAAVRKLAQGEQKYQVSTQGTDEVVELAQAFNQLSHSLAEGEALRKRMAANVAHELRTPVTVLRGHLEAILDDVFPLDKTQITVALDQTLHLTRLVADLRLLTLAEAGQVPLEHQTTSPEQLVSRTIESFAPLAVDAGVDLTFDAVTLLPDIHIDVDRIRQVLGNLLVNGLRHTPAGGRITVRITRQETTVCFEVSNTGSGLTPEQIDRLFEPFWRADDARNRDSGGSGLGLAIAKQLVQLHGGRMWAEQCNAETVFAFEIPTPPT